MKIRTLLAAAALAAGTASSFVATPASAWTCPTPYTQEYWVDNPVTGGKTRICSPYLSCETCYGDVR
jgi:Spy/CpxP family protein refolding chaperone